jgi:AP-3 complex subunit beta
MAEPSDKDFYESSGGSEEAESEEEGEKKKPYVMDQDHRLLLKTCKPLLNSRNGSVSTTSIHR